MLKTPGDSGNVELLANYDFLDLCLLGETGTRKTHTAKLIRELLNTALENHNHNRIARREILASVVRVFKKNSSGWGTDLGSDLSQWFINKPGWFKNSPKWIPDISLRQAISSSQT